MGRKKRASVHSRDDGCTITLTHLLLSHLAVFVFNDHNVSYCFTILRTRILLPLVSIKKKNVRSPPTRGVNITAPKSGYDEYARVHVFSFQRVAV